MKDSNLLEIFLAPLRKCSNYQPAFGQSGKSGLSLCEFQDLYGADPFYSWLGLAEPVVYSAHKAAGGLTSVYRQLGIGSERLFQALLKYCFHLSDQDISWSYEYSTARGKPSVHTLDAKISCYDLNERDKERVLSWLIEVRLLLSQGSKLINPLDGVIFEVRQGYKSADSKRQNADLRFGIKAYQASFLPSLALLSTQVSEPVADRYRRDGILVLTGLKSSDPTVSTFAFFNEVVGYDLSAFFERNSDALKLEVMQIIEKLLRHE